MSDQDHLTALFEAAQKLEGLRATIRPSVGIHEFNQIKALRHTVVASILAALPDDAEVYRSGDHTDGTERFSINWNNHWVGCNGDDLTERATDKLNGYEVRYLPHDLPLADVSDNIAVDRAEVVRLLAGNPLFAPSVAEQFLEPLMHSGIQINAPDWAREGIPEVAADKDLGQALPLGRVRNPNAAVGQGRY